MEELNYLVETNNLTKIYSHHKVVDNVNMHIPLGEIYGFVGENGSGKTTIMRLLTGLAEPSRGGYSLFGISHKDKKIYKARKSMSALVETASLVPTMTALENMEFQELYLGIKLSEEERKEYLKKVHLENVGKKKVKNFSLGMRQRLAIALALINKPKLMFLDEPMNGLDPQGIAELRDLLVEINKRDKITILISSHILSELEKIASTYGFISHGKLLQEISAVELQQKCKKSLLLKVSDIDKVEKLLKENNIKEYKVSPNGDINIYDEVDIGDIVTKINKDKVKILSINSSDQSVEDYYFSLIGGAN